MLNLSFVFDGAIDALAGNSEHLVINPLPAAVYMMQMDVINHYNHALDHYFTLTLSESFLQNSSLGTPYQKWAFFTNKNFSMLSFAIHNLLRSTSRLIHETDCIALRKGEKFSEMKKESHRYTGPICDINYRDRSIGIAVHEDNHLSVTKFGREPLPGSAIMQSERGQPTEYFVITLDSNGADVKRPCDGNEFDRYVASTHSQRLPIGDRTMLQTLRKQGKEEIAILAESAKSFAEKCNEFYRSRNVAEPFRKLNEEYWI